MMIALAIRPEAITFDPQQIVLIVMDMQNAHAMPDGYLDLTEFDASATHPVIVNIQTAVTATRMAGMLIIWFRSGWDKQYAETGGPGSPNFHKSNALRTMRNQPQLQGKPLARDFWDHQLVNKLAPQPGDIVLPKPRYNSFSNTPLDSILHSRGIRHLVFTGITTNVCVESALHGGFLLGYFGVMLEDAAHRAGSELIQRAALFNIKTFFGWVSNVEMFRDTLFSTSLARVA